MKRRLAIVFAAAAALAFTPATGWT